ncbi:MAG: class A beta-lactamase, subclass A2 [Chryseobacterium sp.]|jgi:beta-lactamase class A|uniref:class A beta-lactamase, subclass A2 n=1 Tax=Chryseobacterium sp. TaxID=1871047 RepID=UPI00281ECBBC|nr:class A beta-lactamase, subclass A2 [Chryseobacterium sp.]MDR2236846.1 class A beta-lactamase, subclass A2 [Chryseobacterium sp.]
MKKILFLASVCIIGMHMKAQSTENLRTEIHRIITAKHVTAGISIKNIEDKDTLTINGKMLMPMMSVFKFHIALAVLDQVDQGKLKLHQKIFIKKEDLLPDTWSPMRDDFPEGNTDITLDRLLRYTVSHSDNNGCDILLRMMGTENVQKFIRKQGIKDITIRLNEEQMGETWDNLYVNVTTPEATSLLLEKFYKGKILKKNTTDYLYRIMAETSRGLTWMKAGLPSGTQLAHRTGISGTNDDGLRAGMNDVGIFKLPNGKPIILSVYLKNITEERSETEKIIADIAKAVYDNYNIN